MYLVIGASGFVGPYLLKNILRNTEDEVIATYRSKKANIDDKRISWHQLDVENSAEVESFCADLKNKNTPLKVIYLLAISSPDYVEKNPQLSFGVNVTALENLIGKIPNISTFYFASSDSVYGESIGSRIFSENDALKPVNQYGEQKALGEKIVLALGQNILRLPLMVGKSMCDKKHLYDVIVENLSSDKEIEMFSDSYRNCIDFNQVAKFTINLIEKYQYSNVGIVNLCSDEAISRYDLALLIAKKFSYKESLIKPVESETGQVFTAKRAKKTLLDNSKLKQLLGLDKIAIEV